MKTNANFVQIVPQTKEEKVAMYMKHSKKEIIEMLINCNDMIDLKIKNESTHEEQEYINFGLCDEEGSNYTTIYKHGCNFEDFKKETLDICKNISRKERIEIRGTDDIVTKVICGLVKRGWSNLSKSDAVIEDAIVLDTDTRVDKFWEICYKQHVELFGKEFIDSIIDKK